MTTRGVCRRGTGNKNGSKWIRPERRIALYERDGWQCAFCGQGPRDHARFRKPGEDGKPLLLSLDHLIPRSEGGSHRSENLVTCCGACNSSRQDRPWREFAPGGAIDRIEFLITQPVDMKLGKALLAAIKGEGGKPDVKPKGD